MNESSQPGLEPGQKVGRGRFILIRKLGAGGMGLVWLARDERLDEQVALKFLPALVNADADALETLRKETIRARNLSHPNILRLHDFHNEPDEPAFISMEYVQGKTLAELRQDQVGGVFSWVTLAPLVKQLCAALEYAHGKGVIHRDLKPANLMVDNNGQLKLADFGISVVVNDSRLRMTGLVGNSGTLTYMSPQQMMGKTPKPTDDVYALGATLYCLLTSRPPFYQGYIRDYVLCGIPDPIPQRLKDLAIQNDLPPEVCTMVMACLEKEPDQRPTSASIAWKQVEHIAAWASFEAKPITPLPSDKERPARLEWMADKVGLVPDLRKKENLYQGICVLAFTVVGAFIGNSRAAWPSGVMLGAVGGLAAGTILSGFVILVLGLIRKS